MPFKCLLKPDRQIDPKMIPWHGQTLAGWEKHRLYSSLIKQPLILRIFGLMEMCSSSWAHFKSCTVKHCWSNQCPEFQFIASLSGSSIAPINMVLLFLSESLDENTIIFEIRSSAMMFSAISARSTSFSLVRSNLEMDSISEMRSK